MPGTPHDALGAALERRGTPEHRRMDLAGALSAWLGWTESHACPTVEAAGAYLDGLVAKHGRSGAQGRYATFQIAAAYTWGAHATRHLATVLRSRLVTEKPLVATGAAAYATPLARLPEAWWPGFERIIATQVSGGGKGAGVHWSETRIRSVLASLAAWHEFRTAAGQSPVPSGAGFEHWAAALRDPARTGGAVAATTVATYLARVLDGYGAAVAPGFHSAACRLVIDDWTARAEEEPTRRNKTARTVGASTLYMLGLEMIDEAMAAPVIGIASARTCRNGLLLSVGACLPQRARALSWLVFDETLFLEAGFIIRVFLPAAALKGLEKRKGRRRPFERTFRNRRLWGALDTWRRVFRPLYDEGAWLFPSQLSTREGISEDRLGAICRAETRARLGVAISIHDVRDNVATEASEYLDGGALKAAGLLDHRDPRTTLAHYDHADDLRVLHEHGRFLAEKQADAPDLVLGYDEDDGAAASLYGAEKPAVNRSVVRFRPSPDRTPSAGSAAGG